LRYSTIAVISEPDAGRMASSRGLSAEKYTYATSNSASYTRSILCSIGVVKTMSISEYATRAPAGIRFRNSHLSASLVSTKLVSSNADCGTAKMPTAWSTKSSESARASPSGVTKK